MSVTLPSQAEMVVIGGGIIGASLAYHLTKLGKRDVVLLEQGTLSCGTTWHAAGLVGQLRAHPNMTRLIRYSTELYASLEAETGLATGWKQTGSLTVARTPERMTQLKRTASAARAQNVAIDILTPEQAGEKFPIMRTDDLVGAVWLPGDGKANPADITQSLARGARNRGARIFERTRVTGIRTDRGRVTAVETDQGAISCEKIAICAGQWSRAVGAMCGVTVPLHSAEHMYIVTGRIEGVAPSLPVMRDPDGFIYFKEEVGGLVMGGFEPNAKPWGMGGIPYPFEFQLLPDDWEQFEILMKNALHRVPALETADIKTFLNGPESFTADNNYILGEAPEVRNVFVAAGFNSMGIASGGGAGKALAEWMVEGAPSLDLWPVDIRRFARFNGNDAWLKDRVTEVLGLHYAMPWPNRELESARPFRRSPLYDRLAAKRAVFGSKMGWERPNYFARCEDEKTIRYSYGKQNWFEAVGEEHRAAREAVALFDLTSFAKFMLQGRDAVQALNAISANEIDVPIGQTVYTPLLNARGGFESDLTVARLATDQFLIITGTAQATRDADHIRRHLPPEARATLIDVTSAYAVLGVMGPKARNLLSRVTTSPLAHEAFPFGAIREIGIGHATALAARRSYVGELGWELYVPTEFAGLVHDTLVAAGPDLCLRYAGYYALNSLRIEKGYRAWGAELTPDVTPWQAGMGFAVRSGKPGGFIGTEALQAARQSPLSKRLISFRAVDSETPMAWGGEMIAADGRPVGEVTSAAYGYTLGAICGLGWVNRPDGPVDEAWLATHRFSIDIAGATVPIEVSLKPFYDPSSQRVRM